MKTETRWSQVKELFDRATEVSQPDRLTFLQETCGDDRELLSNVLVLLEADPSHLDFLKGGLFEEMPLLQLPQIGQAVGPYRLVRELGQGGMGLVFLARRCDETHEREVALKFLAGGFASMTMLRQFLRERQILARLSHPHIARMYDAGATDHGQPYLVMEYVQGTPITEFCGQNRLSMAQRMALFTKVCDAVQYAHRNLIIHRDLKPGNILVTGNGEPKLLDFGIAKVLGVLGEHRTGGGAATGVFFTPQYASPEQCRGEPVTTASDVYSLGIILYELLTGSRPPEREKSIDPRRPGPPVKPSQAVLINASTEDRQGPAEVNASAGLHVDPRRLRRHLKGDLDRIVLKALHPEDRQRYESPRELSEDLSRYRHQLPVRAHQSSLPYTMAKFFRRHRGAVILGAAMLMVLTGFLVTVTRQRSQLLRERDRAQVIADFMESVFHETTPHAGNGADFTVREILEQAAENLKADFANQPHTRLALMESLGRTMVNNGMGAKGTPMLLEVLKQTHQLAPKERADIHQTLGKAYENANDNENSVDHYLQAIALMEDCCPNRNVSLGDLYGSVANVLSKSEKRQEADPYFDKALEFLNHETESDGQYQLAGTYGAIGRHLMRGGQLEGAEAYLSMAIEGKIALYGHGNRSLASTLNNMALLLKKKGEYRRALTHYEMSRDLTAEVFGEEHIYYTRVLNNMAALWIRLGQPETALPLFLEVLKREGQHGQGSPRNPSLTYNNLGQCYQKLGNHTQAEYYLLKALEPRDNGKRGTSLASIAIRTNLANLYGKSQCFEQAEGLLEEALALVEKRYGDDSLFYAKVCHVQGQTLRRAGRLKDAEEAVERTLAIRKKHLNSDHPDLADTLFILARIYKETDRRQAARDHAQSVRSIWVKKFGPDYKKLAEINHFVSSLN